MSAKTGDRVRANHYNFDGRHNDIEAGIFEPDIDDPQEVIEGVLTVLTIDSAWGQHQDYIVKMDNGAVRYVEPDTAVKVGG